MKASLERMGLIVAECCESNDAYGVNHCLKYQENSDTEDFLHISCTCLVSCLLRCATHDVYGDNQQVESVTQDSNREYLSDHEYYQ